MAAALVIFACIDEADVTGAPWPAKPSLKNSKLQVSEGNFLS